MALFPPLYANCYVLQLEAKIKLIQIGVTSNKTLVHHAFLLVNVEVFWERSVEHNGGNYFRWSFSMLYWSPQRYQRLERPIHFRSQADESGMKELILIFGFDAERPEGRSVQFLFGIIILHSTSWKSKTSETESRLESGLAKNRPRRIKGREKLWQLYLQRGPDVPILEHHS